MIDTKPQSKTSDTNAKHITNRYSWSFGVAMLTILASSITILFLYASLDQGTMGSCGKYDPAAELIAPSDLNEYLDADAIGLQDLIYGLKRGNLFRYWNFGNYIPLLPTMVVYAPLTYLLQNIGLTQLIYSLLQILILQAVFAVMLKRIFTNGRWQALTIGIALSSLIFIYPLYWPDLDVCRTLLMPFHSGTLINSMITYILAHEYLKKQKNFILVSIGIFTAFAAFSSPLFHIQATAPIIIAIVGVESRNIKRHLKPIVAILVGGAVGYICMKWFSSHIAPIPQSSDRLLSLKTMFGQFRELISQSPVSAAVVLLFAGAFLYSMGHTVRAIIAGAKRTETHRKVIDGYTHYHAFMAFLIVTTCIAPIAAGNYYGTGNVRYLSAVIYIGIFSWGTIIVRHSQLLKTLELRKITCALSILLILFVGYRSLQQNPFNAFPRLAHYQNNLALAVDELSVKYPIKNGVANYWNSKTIGLFSKANNKAMTTYNNLAARNHINYLLDYRYDDPEMTKTARFNYIILEGWGDTSDIYSLFGDSVKRVECRGFEFLLVPEFIYDEGISMHRTGIYDFSTIDR